MDNFKARWDRATRIFDVAVAGMTKESAEVICTLNSDKTAFQNALEYSNELGLRFGDPLKPKQTLGRSLADIILKQIA